MFTALRPSRRDDSIGIMEFANGGVGMVENSWAKRGGMDDRTEIYGEGGVSYPICTWAMRYAHL
jgi:myo-inositol 2-dehydrogenase / D-chiro-inositol 1-dehydrogenase